MGFEQARSASSFKVGWIVETPNDPRCIGKVAAVADTSFEIQYYRSLSFNELASVRSEAVRRAYLSPQTRVYFRRPAEDRWRIGRVRNYFVEDDASVTYEVRTPNRTDFDVHETGLFVRCFGQGSDPAEVLALGAAESQIWHDARWGARKVLTRLRAAANGMTALSSASIELVPHQTEAVKRVLLDPLQRYLLADEVGLGKTIEAGAIIRQALTDRSTNDVLVVTPASLIAQWRDELATRFGLVEDGERLRIAAFEDLVDHDGAHLLVVDEAHQCSFGTTAFEDVDRLVKASSKLLLLSATPIIGAEEAFLSLLRWLDGERWDRESPDSFRDLLRKSQEHGRLMLGLRPDASSFLLKQRVAAASAEFPGDETVQSLTQEFGDASPERRAEICADLRDHVADVYRIHHRLVRSRRQDMQGWEFKPRGPSLVREEVDTDEANADAAAILEEWRGAALLALEAGVAEERLLERYRTMIEVAGRGAHALANLESYDPLFEGEGDLIGALREIGGRSDARQASAFVAIVAERQVGFLRKVVPTPKIVIFATAAPEVLAGILRERLGDAFVHSRADLRGDLGKFKDDPRAAVILLGRESEEGLNLHFADAIIHADLPFNIGRIEQRIGRLDRFGRAKGPIKHIVVLPSDEEYGPWSTWLQTLKKSLGIFDRPVSDIQFVLDEIEAQIIRTLLHGGGPGNADREDRLQARIAEERQKLDEQYALDVLAFGRASGRELVDEMEKAEADEGRIAGDVDRLLVNLLNFERRSAGLNTFRLTWNKDTQLPAWPWRAIFAPGLERPLTWRRNTAGTTKGVALLRPGDALIDGLDRLLDWDDRGSAFATWRFRPGLGAPGEEQIAARLCWRISAVRIAQEGLAPEDDARGLDRRAASFLSPSTIVQHLYADLTDIEDAELLDILSEPYRTDAESGAGRDFNLGSRSSWLASILDDAEFGKLCRDVQRAGLARLHQNKDLQDIIKRAATGAARDAHRRNKRDANRMRSEIELNDAVTSAVANPAYRLDSVGIFIVAGYVPRGKGV